MRCISIISVIVVFLCAQNSLAGFSTFQGIDPSPGGTVPLSGNAATARANFMASLSTGVGTEDFESFPVGPADPLNLSFPAATGTVTATLTGGGATIDGTAGSGRFATSGSQFLQTTSGGDFNIAFSQPIAAFGFYATDLGDFAGDLQLTLSNGTTKMVTVPTAGLPNGNLVFWGFRDNMDSYTNIAFLNTGPDDVFGFDDMTVGDPTVILPPTIPEPNAFLAVSLVALAAGARRWRKRTAHLRR